MAINKEKNNLGYYLITIITLFFLAILLFNLFSTYNHYVAVKGEISKISDLVSQVKSNNSKLKSEYQYYNSNYYKENVSSSDLNLVKGKNSTEIVLPANSVNSFVNVNNSNKRSNPVSVVHNSPSFVSWLKLLF